MEQQNIKSAYTNAQAQRERGTWDNDSVNAFTEWYGRKLSRSLMTHQLSNWLFYFHEENAVNGKLWTETVDKWLKRIKDLERENSSVQQTVMTFCMWGALPVLHFILKKQKQELLSLRLFLSWLILSLRIGNGPDGCPLGLKGFFQKSSLQIISS